jgi:hypothetical protein
MISKSVGGTADNRFAEGGARSGNGQSVARSEPVIRIPHPLQIGVLGHSLDQIMRFGQARVVEKYELNALTWKFRQRVQGVSDRDFFLENKARAGSRPPFQN